MARLAKRGAQKGTLNFHVKLRFQTMLAFCFKVRSTRGAFGRHRSVFAGPYLALLGAAGVPRDTAGVQHHLNRLAAYPNIDWLIQT